MSTGKRVEIAVLCTLILMICATFGISAVPGQINFQGRLADATGEPVEDNDYTMTFAIYDVASGGTPLWSEGQTIPVTNGIYSVILGQPGNEIDAAVMDGERYLGVSVETDAEMTYRLPVTSTIFALRSAISDTADTVTGPLDLPPNGLAVGGDQLVVTDGKVGLGTSSPNEQLELTGNLRLPATTETTGIIRSGANTLIHSYGTNNFFAGEGAGNLTMTGDRNTASGAEALFSNTTGVDNTANGAYALISNTTGDGNTASGAYALNSNITGYENTASGSLALFYNTTGFHNTANGAYALNQNTTGNYNTASGLAALYSNTTGYQNTASGSLALSGNTTGYNNTANGSYALNQNTTGNYNTAIGCGSNTTAGNLINATAIGAGAIVSASDQVRIGNDYVTQIGGMVGWSNISDMRRKKDIKDITVGLDFINGLRPVEFRMIQGNDRLDFGFIAQDIEALLGMDYNVLGVGGDSDRTLSLRYTDFIAPVVKAIQEQQGIISELRAEIESLKAEIKSIKADR
jgi:hypothetical protein